MNPEGRNPEERPFLPRGHARQSNRRIGRTFEASRAVGQIVAQKNLRGNGQDLRTESPECESRSKVAPRSRWPSFRRSGGMGLHTYGD
ncbi:hypothetical protein KM043_001861 [Ampulex compressa]|nr:hypothetical protein KM043_001861 [Ampulex compressa]